MKTVKLKSHDKLKKLVKEGKIKILNASDCGEWVTYGVVDGAYTHIYNVSTFDHDQDFEVTKLDNSISENQLNRLGVLFERP
jgi:hypothetical protein